MPRWLKDNGLSIGFGLIFLGSLVGQAISGHDSVNHDAHLHHSAAISLGHYVTSAVFWADVMENWQSEYLQFTLYILATVWLLQKGSNESKRLGPAGRETDEEQLLGEHAKRNSPAWARAGGLADGDLLELAGSRHGLDLARLLARPVDRRPRQLQRRPSRSPRGDRCRWPPTSTTSDFSNRTLQNWQSEFLAVGSMAILSVYLRQRGSPESKPVGAPHSATGIEG